MQSENLRTLVGTPTIKVGTFLFEFATPGIGQILKAAGADFAVLDDIDNAEAGACQTNASPQFVAISASPWATTPVIYLTLDGPADYRIFVSSKTFSARDAAALIVGARGGQRHASL